jgi:hypothetical protein
MAGIITTVLGALLAALKPGTRLCLEERLEVLGNAVALTSSRPGLRAKPCMKIRGLGQLLSAIQRPGRCA